jgi:hypothetical protein
MLTRPLIGGSDALGIERPAGHAGDQARLGRSGIKTRRAV